MITSPYGYRYHPIDGGYRFHNGVDLAVAQGTPVYATKSGTVTTATFSSGYGYYVTINHGDGFSSLYGHMTHYTVSSGDYVNQGDLIGYVGSTVTPPARTCISRCSTTVPPSTRWTMSASAEIGC